MALASARLWNGIERLVAPLAFAGGVLAAGAIVANRFDTAVAFLIAAALWLLVLRQHVAAAAALGLGFALKLTPVLLLPIVVILARRWWAAVGGLLRRSRGPLPRAPRRSAPRGDRALRRGAASRSRERARDAAAPVSSAGAHARPDRQRVWIAGGRRAGRGADDLALVDSARDRGALRHLRDRPPAPRVDRPENVALPVLAVLLTFVVFGKVLSPQFLIWLLPAAALLAPRHPLLAGLFGGIVALTQVEFPSLFRALVALRPEAISVVALRNTGIVALRLLGSSRCGASRAERTRGGSERAP